MNGLLTRMLGAACLNPHTFEEIEADPRATFQAVIVVILVSISAGIGGVLTYGIGGIIIGPLVGVIQWVVWAFVTYLVGTTILKKARNSRRLGTIGPYYRICTDPGLVENLGIPTVKYWFCNFIHCISMAIGSNGNRRQTGLGL
ncbi:MAG: hypothetical protein CM1200mP35_06980 [Chloroflexota bacterium]|nr:MAG: hypothetical protein CM1200mP35_06980 [Chloroflexota bacterium]